MRLAITATLIITATVAAQPDPEGAMGVYPVPQIVAMSGECSGYVVARGVVSQADHEAAEGFANIGDHFGLSMRPRSPFYLRVLELRGKPVEVVLRPIPPREMERIR